MRIVSENPLFEVLQELERYRSETVCFKRLCRRSPQKELNEGQKQLLKEKARGLSFAVSNGLSFYQKSTEALSSDLVSAYYAEMWLWMAGLLADPTNSLTLTELQKWTANGHGLGTHIIGTGEFPDNVIIYLKADGFLRRYLKSQSITLPVRNKRVESDEDANEVVNSGEGHRLTELLLRIPELESTMTELLERDSYVHKVVYSTFKNSGDARRPKNHQLDGYYTWLQMHSKRIGTDPVLAQNLKVPLIDIEALIPTGRYDSPGVVGKFHHHTEFWHGEFNLYSSPYADMRWIEPLWGANNEIRVIHFMCLYAWSIFARYMPAIWQRIQTGNLDHFHSVISQHLSILRRLSPQITLQSIRGERVSVSQPGSMVGSSVQM